MAHNIFHTGTEWLSNVKKDAEKYVTKKVIDYKVDNYVKSFTDEFKGPTKITPAMAAEGWKPGLDGVPYNSKLNEKFEPGGIFYDPDVDKNTAIANAVASGKVSSAEAGTETTSPFLSQDLRQRTPSGTIYNPSMEAFDNASLFNYEGPGGVAEYTYGQGLPIDYGVYGTPPGPNLYYEGQFGEGFVEPGVADSAIELPAVTMPDGVPQVPSNNASNKKKDLTYAETIAEMGIAPGDAPSTLFPGPGQEISSTKQANMPGFNGMNPNFLVSQADQGPDIGLANYTNNGTVSAEDQARFDAAKMERFNPTGGPSIYDTQYTVGANNAMSPVGPSIYDTQYTVGANNAMSPVGPSIYDTMTSPTMIGGDEQVFEGSYEMNPNDDGAFAYGGSQPNQGNFETANQMVGGSLPTNIMRNPNEETQQYRGIYVDPRTVPEINDVETSQTFMPSFPADYGDGTNIQTITDVPYISDVPIVAGDIENASIFQDTEDLPVVTDSVDNTSVFQDIELPSGPPITVNLNQSYPSDNYSPTPQYGIDEAVVDSGKYIYDVLTSGNTGNANAGFVQAVTPPATTTGYAGNIQINPFALDMSASEMAYQDAIANQVANPTNGVIPVADTGPDLTTLMQKMSGGIDGEINYAPGSTGAIDAIVANKLLQEQAAAERAAKAQAAAAEKARQAAAAQKRMNDRYETGPVARAPAPAPRPTAPAGGYSTKSVNNNFATRRDIRNIFA